MAETLERGARGRQDYASLRSNFVPYQGINVLMLWAEAVEKGFAAPIWMTFKQALELGGHVRKGEKGSLVVYASSITRTGSGKTNFAIITHEMKRRRRDEELARVRGR